MSTNATRTNIVDKYKILSNYEPSSNVEHAIVQTLVQSGYENKLINPPIVYDVSVNGVVDSSWNTKSLDASYVNTSAISNYPNGTVTEYSVLSTELLQSDVSVNSYTTNISSLACANNSYVFQDLSSSSSYYDSNYVVTQSLIADCSDNVAGSFVKATFDVDASNAKIQYAMQSRWNTLVGPYNNGLADVGPDPTAMMQDVSYNTEQAFGMQGTAATDASYEAYWAKVDPSNGSLIFTKIDVSYQAFPQGFIVSDRDMSGVILGDEDYGIFKIQQTERNVQVQLSTNDNSFATITPSELIEIPLFDGNSDPSGVTPNSVKNSMSIPGDMNYSEFQTLVNQDVINSVEDGWTFQIDISSGEGGYDISGTEHPLVSDLDDSNLLDNPYYMKNYVRNTHRIIFADASINIVDASNGDQSVINSIQIDLSQGEKLDASYAGVSGEIIVNTNTLSTRYTDLSNVDVSTSVIPLVSYSNDSTDLSNSITTDMQNNYYFKGMWQKIAQKSDTTSSDYYLNKSNEALMTLYTGTNGIVDNSYNESDFSFNFIDDSFVGTEEIRLWKIFAYNSVIVNPSSFYKDASYTDAQPGISTGGVITNLTDDINYNGYRILLEAKTKEQLGLWNAVQDVSGWVLDYDVSSSTYLTSSSNQAYTETGVVQYNTEIVRELSDVNDASFSYTYQTVESDRVPGGLVDSVAVVYDFSSVQYSSTIQQSDITRDYTTNNFSYVTIPDASYDFTGTYLNKNTFELIYATTTSTFDARFFPDYGPFTNIQLTINDIEQTDKYYAIRNKNTGELEVRPYLNNVNIIGTWITSDELKTINETLEPTTGNSLSIQGTFSSNDLKPFISEPQGEIADNSWNTIGQRIHTDVYYGLNNVDGVLDSGAELVSNIQYSPFVQTNNQSINVELGQENYYIPFTYDLSGGNFVLSSITTNSLDISSNTHLVSSDFMSNLEYLTLENGYQEANFGTGTYTIEYDSTTNPLLTVKNGANTIFTIQYLNNTVFLGDIYVTYIPQDYYRTQRLLGVSDSSNTYSEEFIITSYESSLVDLSSNLQGLYISNNAEPANSSLDSSSIQLGAYSSFRVQGDYAKVNEVGSALPVPDASSELGLSSYNSGSLQFQYVDASNYSAAFTFDKYRGYFSYGTTETNQYYTIERDAVEVYFKVDGSGVELTDASDQLISNMYVDASFVVDNIRDGSNALVANLNLTGSFNYSMQPNGTEVEYIVNVTGDKYVVTLVNDQGVQGDVSGAQGPDYTPVKYPYESSGNLMEYGINDLYTFSNPLWNSPPPIDASGYMAARPSRVKLNNTDFSYNTMRYRILVEFPQIVLYKAKAKTTIMNDYQSWLGNPQEHGSQDNTSDVNPNLWQQLRSIDQSGSDPITFDIGKKTLDFSGNTQDLRIVYHVSTPPYYKFEQISTENCPEIPYNYDVSYLENRTVRYMPFLNRDDTLLNVFNPFDVSINYTDISAVNTTVYTDASYLNNVTFTLLQSPTTITTAAETPDSTRYGILVPGTNIAVSLYLGLHNSTTPGDGRINPIWNAPVTSIPDTPDINNNALLFRSRDDSGAIFFSALQYPEDIGYSPGADGYEQVLHTDVSSNWYNIDFKMGNTSWFNNNVPVTYFDTDANGIKPTLYTVVDVNNPATQTNFRRVYKYETDGSIDIDTSGSTLSGLQTFNLPFTGRSYRDFDISMSSTFPTSGIWKYEELLSNTEILTTPITWTTDSSFSNAYVSWSFGNSTTSKNMMIELFGVQDTQNKWVYVHLEPFVRYLNQFNLQVGSVAWDGSLTAPLVITREVNLAPSLADPIMTNNSYATQQYSESTLLDYDNGTA